MISEDHVTQDRSNDAENTTLITEINYILLYIQIENSCCIAKLYFGSTQCRLGEKRLLKNIKNLTVQKLLTGRLYTLQKCYIVM